MSIRLMIICGGAAWGACVSGSLIDPSGASLPRVQVTLESLSAPVAETIAAENGHFQICTDVPGEYRIVAKIAGFHRRSTPAFELRSDLDLGGIAMRINMDDVVCNLPILLVGEPYPYFDAGGGFVRFTGRDGKRRKFARQSIDRQYSLDGDWKRVVFLRGNELWVNNRRIYTHNAAMWAPEFTPDGRSIRFWSSAWETGDHQTTVPIQGR